MTDLHPNPFALLLCWGPLLFIFGLPLLVLVITLPAYISRVRAERLKIRERAERIAQRAAAEERKVQLHEAKLAAEHNKVVLQDAKLEETQLKIKGLQYKQKLSGMDAPDFTPEEHTPRSGL